MKNLIQYFIFAAIGGVTGWFLANLLWAILHGMG